MSKNLLKSQNVITGYKTFLSVLKEKVMAFFINVANVVEYLKNIFRNLISNKFEFQEF